MWKNLIGLFAMQHVFLYPEIRHPQVEVKCCTHANRREIGCPMTAGSNMIQCGQVGDAPQMGDAACVCNGGTNVVDELLLDELLAVPYRVEDLAYGQWGDGVLANQAETFLIFSRDSVLKPV